MEDSPADQPASQFVRRLPVTLRSGVVGSLADRRCLLLNPTVGPPISLALLLCLSMGLDASFQYQPRHMFTHRVGRTLHCQQIRASLWQALMHVFVTVGARNNNRRSHCNLARPRLKRSRRCTKASRWAGQLSNCLALPCLSPIASTCQPSQPPPPPVLASRRPAMHGGF